MSAEIHVGDIGTSFEATIKDETGAIVSLVGAVTLQMIFTKPPGSTPNKVVKTALLVTDGTDGKIKYTVVADDLNRKGTWRVQGYVKLSNGEWYSDIHVFDVRPNL